MGWWDQGGGEGRRLWCGLSRGGDDRYDGGLMDGSRGWPGVAARLAGSEGSCSFTWIGHSARPPHSVRH